MPVRTVLSGFLAALVAASVVLAPTPAHAETTLCIGKSFTETAKCDPAWAVNMTFMHWRMYAGHNCTNYVAWRLSVDGVTQPSYRLGNAGSWASAAKRHGVPVNGTPAAGSVATWPGRNHVAYVEEVRPDSLLISEDSWSQKRYRKFIVFRGERNYPSQFIHFKGAPGQPTITGGTPAVLGKPLVGETLTAQAGTWQPAGVNLAYQWLRDGAIIGGATGQKYRLTPADGGRKISVSITGTKAGLPARTAWSQPTEIVGGSAIAPGTPSVQGTPVKGNKLKAVVGAWAPNGLKFAYQWYAGGAAIPGATKSTLKLASQHVGQAISVRVTGSRKKLAPASATSTPVVVLLKKGSPPPPPLAPKPLPSVVAGVPAITALPVMMVGETLTANPGIWGPAPVTTSVQWTRAGIPIPGATGITYRLTDADVGKTVAVAVSGSKPGHTAASATSVPTPVVVARQLRASVEPSVAGDPLVGGQLTVSPGTWSPAGYSTTIQWTRGGQPIAGATGPTYQPTAADLRQAIGAMVTATLPSVPAAVRTLTFANPVRAVPVIKVKVDDAKPKKSKALRISVHWLGNPVAGPVTISEAGQVLATVHVPAEGAKYIFTSSKGPHALELAFGGADGFLPTTAGVPVKIK